MTTTPLGPTPGSVRTEEVRGSHAVRHTGHLGDPAPGPAAFGADSGSTSPAAAGTPVATPFPDRRPMPPYHGFGVDGVNLHRTGLAVNPDITACYGAIDRYVDAYIGDPPMTTWSELAVNASTEAGTAMREIESTLSALRTIRDSSESVADRAAAIERLRDSLLRGNGIQRAIGLAMATVKGGSTDFLAIMENTLQRLGNAFARGNQSIFRDIAPVYEKFFAAESARPGSGVEALRSAGVDTRLIKAFALLPQIRETTDPTERAKLVTKFNLAVADYEQREIIQDVFDEVPPSGRPLTPPRMEGAPSIRDVMLALSESMEYTGPDRKRHRATMGSWDWGDEGDRMRAITLINSTFIAHDLDAARRGSD